MPTLNYLLRVSLRNCIIKPKNTDFSHLLPSCPLKRLCQGTVAWKERECSLPHTFSKTGVMILFKSSLPNQVLIKTCHYCFNVIYLCVKKVNHVHLHFGHLHLFFLLLLFGLVSGPILSLRNCSWSPFSSCFSPLGLKKSPLDYVSTMRTGMETVFCAVLTLHRGWLWNGPIDIDGMTDDRMGNEWWVGGHHNVP